MSHRNETKERYIKSIEEQDNFLYGTVNNIVFNFQFFVSGKNFGQSFEEWESERILADLNKKLKNFSSKTIVDLLKDRTLEIYSQYPEDSKFQKPNIFKNIDVKWVRLRIAGRRRLIGFLLNEEIANGNNTKMEAVKKGKNIFYIIFLDKEHNFAPSKK